MMRTRLLPVVAGLLAAGALAAGCGGGDDDGSGKSSGKPAPQAGAGQTTGPASAGPSPAQRKAVEDCKKQIAGQPGIDGGLKDDLNRICDQAARGNEQEARQAAKDVCTKIVESNVPAGVVRDQAAKACDSAG